MTNELLQQVRVLDPAAMTDRVADVLIVDGKIEAIADSISEWPTDSQVRDGRGLILGPGLVDLYSHSGEPGFEDRETLRSLQQAAIAGGFTRLNILPDTTPALDNPAGLAWLQDKRQFQLPVQVRAWGALTLGVQGQQMTELAELGAAGVVGFADGRALSSYGLLRRLLEYLQPLQKPVALWPCDPKLTGNGVMREGPESIRFGLPGSPAIAETTAIAALFELVAAIGTPVHIMRVSTARSVELIQVAKERGLPITASTTWMHLLLNSQAIQTYDPNLRLEPPLGNLTDQAALIDGIRQGVLDAIAIDHTPYTYEEKTVAFAEAPPGAIGLELALPLLWQRFVMSGEWTALELWRVLSSNPAKCLQQPVATVAPGQPAELALFDPSQPWVVSGQSLKSLSINTPWLGQELLGQIVQTWCPSS
ncbi:MULTISPECIES: dihydroorotase [Trichocoleus]|uniref:Dihydroorotase n=1 Tax=Trichocoleus desertorum GB2-A4 TaxID=2933944 RepID=A0ABV0J5W8_9CYAN|nr:dihydroorotase [Trichocoleus sp. FACHB-46]MBD1863300.1 dihydroorotase [Trichocoleus sp. FACHB-46]